MSENHKHSKRPRFQPRTPQQVEEARAEDGLDEQEEWNPTPAQMDAYLDREVEMARSNLVVVLSRSKFPQSFKELKDSTLHTSETVEQALTSLLASAKAKEVQGRFVLA